MTQNELRLKVSNMLLHVTSLLPNVNNFVYMFGACIDALKHLPDL